MATLIRPDGTKETVTPADGKHFTLEEMQKLVEGYIQIIQVPVAAGKWADLVMNEEGKFEGLAYNKEATALGRIAGIADDDFIVGNAVLCEDGEAQDDEDE